MGDWKRLVGFALAMVGIGLSLFMPWWRVSTDLASLEITLSKATICSGGTCASVDTGMGLYGIMATMTLGYGVAALLAIGLGGVRPALAGDGTRAWAPIAGLFYAMMALMTMSTLDLPKEVEEMFGVERTIWYWGGVGGGLLALFTPLLARIGLPREEPAPILYRPHVVTQPPPIDAAPPRAQRPSHAPIDLDGPVPEMPPAPPPPTVRPSLPRALDSAEVRDDGVTAIDVGGRVRMVRWTDLAGVLAREAVGQLFVDLVPRGGPPLRFTSVTRMTFDVAGAPVGRGAREQLRRVIALARAHQPAIEVERATVGFVDADDDLPIWSEVDLASYDRRYG